MPARRPGRPTEIDAPVTRVLHVRLTTDEHAALVAIAAERSLPLSRLVRRAVREIVTGGPDLFDDGVEQMSRLAARLASLERTLRDAGAADTPELQPVIDAVALLRGDIAALVRASRDRWVGVR